MESPHNSRDLTTGEAAGLLRCSQQTVIRLFDAGKLKGHRIPGSRFRKIPMLSALEFMRANGIPIDPKLTGGVLVLDQDLGLSTALRARMGNVDYAADVYRALLKIGSKSPSAVVVNACTIPVPVAIQFALAVEDECDNIRMVCTHPKEADDTSAARHFQCLPFTNPHRTSLDVVRLLEGGES